MYLQASWFTLVMMFVLLFQRSCALSLHTQVVILAKLFFSEAPAHLFYSSPAIYLWSYSPLKLLFIFSILLLLLSCKVVILHLLPFYLKLGITFYDHKNVLPFISCDFNFCDFATFHLLSLCLKLRTTSLWSCNHPSLCFSWFWFLQNHLITWYSFFLFHLCS
jgi:hypothetical protein